MSEKRKGVTIEISEQETNQFLNKSNQVNRMNVHYIILSFLRKMDTISFNKQFVIFSCEYQQGL